MAQLPNTELETHETGTAGVNGIINGNWQRLEELFDDGLSNSDSGFYAFAKALLRDDLSTVVVGTTIVRNASGFKPRLPVNTLTYAASVALPFANAGAAPVQLLALTGNVTLTTSNLTAGQEMRVVITADGSLRTLTFPGAWTFVGAAAPANIAAGKKGVLKLISTTTADSGVVAEWSVQP